MTRATLTVIFAIDLPSCLLSFSSLPPFSQTAPSPLPMNSRMSLPPLLPSHSIYVPSPLMVISSPKYIFSINLSQPRLSFPQMNSQMSPQCLPVPSLASHNLAMKMEGLVQYGYHTCSSGMCGMQYVIIFNFVH